MPRWTSRWVDPRAISHEGQWGLYKCEFCGKLHKYRMCSRKRVKHVYCSTKCKKDAQVNYNRHPISNKLFKQLYADNYELVKTCAFQICEGNTMKLQFLEDCMQYGFLELWKIYNRNGMNCSKKYIRKSIKHAMLDGIRYWFSRVRNELPVDEFDIKLFIDKMNSTYRCDRV